MLNSISKLVKFISSRFLLFILGIFLATGATYVYATWTSPTLAPPEGNIAALINTSNTGQAKQGGLILNTGGSANGLIVQFGNVGIGTTSPGAKLVVVGNIIADAPTASNHLATMGYVDAASGGAPPGNCEMYDDCDGDGFTAYTGDCDESCPTCYIGSTVYIDSADGKDQDCDGQIDEEEAVPCYVIWVTDSTYTGALGGRSGADSKCVADKPGDLDCTEDIKAFLSIAADDEIRDMPSKYGFSTLTPIYWYNKNTQAVLSLATTWADMLDGTILSSQADGTGVTGNYIWTFSQAAGELGSYNCSGGTSGSSGVSGNTGSGSSTGTDWLLFAWENPSWWACHNTFMFRCLCETTTLCTAVR